jgi:hypothetical protein
MNVMTNHEAISAFLDNEPFNARELADALADPEGRALLIDLVALRGVVQPEPLQRAAPQRGRSSLRLAAAAAGLAAALGVGYQVGRGHDAGTPAPPEPTRIIAADTPWQDAR